MLGFLKKTCESSFAPISHGKIKQAMKDRDYQKIVMLCNKYNINIVIGDDTPLVFMLRNNQRTHAETLISMGMVGAHFHLQPKEII